jgi:hypothetical protein
MGIEMDERQSLIRFNQLFHIAYPDGENLRSDCCAELKRQLIYACRRVNPDGIYGDSGYKPKLAEYAIKSLYQECFSDVVNAKEREQS